MSLEKIENNVLAKARADAESVISVAREEGEKELAQFREQVSLEVENAVRNAEIAAARETSRQLSIARQEGRMSVLEAKNKMVDTIMTRTGEKLQSMDEKEYSAMIEQWLTHLSFDIGGIIAINPRDEKIFNPRFLEKINAQRPEAGKYTRIEVNPRIDGGFVILGGSYTADFTIPVLIEKIKESSIGYLAKELFES